MGRCVKRLELSPEFILASFTLDGRRLIFCSGMPTDAAVVGMSVLPNGNLNLLIKSESFPDLPAGCEPLHMEPPLFTTGYPMPFEEGMEMQEKDLLFRDIPWAKP